MIAATSDADALLEQGRALCRAGRLEEGAALFRKLAAAAPGNARAHNLLGMALERLGRPLEALPCFDRAIEADGDLAEAHANRAEALSALGRYREAVLAYDRALALDPDNAADWRNRGIAEHANRRFEDAIESFDRALALDPASAETHLNRAASLRALRRFGQSLTAIEKAITLAPDLAAAHSDHALALRGLDRFEEALAAIERALALAPDVPAYHANRASVLHRLHRLDEVLASFDRALVLDPRFAEAHRGRAVVLADLGRFDEAAASIATALKLAPDDPATLAARGYLHRRAGRIDEACRDQEQALALAPDNDDIALDVGLLRLGRGDWPAAWPLYERRSYNRRVTANPPCPFPRWNGEPLQGGELFLIAEHGRGDAIQFARFATALAERAFRVVLLVRPDMIRLFETVPGVERVLPHNTEVPDDGTNRRWLPLMSVPHVLGTSLETLPAAVPYLRAEPARVAAWGSRLGKHGFKVGIAWQGNPTLASDRARSIPLARFRPLAGIAGVRLVSLQFGPGSEQIDAVPFADRIERLGPEFNAGADAFLDTAAVLMNLDLVVISDTGPVHLAGALARPTFTALAYSADWRWMFDREDSPWYPTLRLFRQRTPGDWDDVFARIAKAVQARMAEPQR